MTAIPLTPAPSYRSTDSLPRRPSDARPSSTSISPINHTSTPRSSSSSSSSPSPTTPSSPIRPISTSSSTSPTDTSGLGSPISAPGGKKDKSRIDLLYAIQDYALKHFPNDDQVSLGAIIPIAEQSAGKSSVLSILLGATLFSAGRTATCGPTHVHSRHRPAETCKASISIRTAHPLDGVKAVHDFARHIGDKEKLFDALRLAGHEARKSRDGSVPLRRYDQMVGFTPAQLAAESQGWPIFTENTVLLWISGPDQPNLSVIDLPGLVGGPNGEDAQAIAETYLSNPKNLVLLCVTAGGGDAIALNPAVQLVRKHDPHGKRTLGLFTKCDHLDDPTDSVCADLISNNSANTMRDWSPRLGWWPVRGRKFDEGPNKVSDVVFDKRVKDLFASDAWSVVQRKSGKVFDIPSLKRVVRGASASMIAQVADDVLATVNREVTRLSENLAQLPAVETKPVGLVHDVLATFVSSLRHELDDKAEFTGKLLKVQQELGKSLCAQIPNFMPFSLDHEGEASTEAFVPFDTSRLVSFGVDLGDLGGGNFVYMDEILGKIREYTNQRNGRCDLRLLHPSWLRHHAKEWSDLCVKHVDAVWKVVDEAAQSVLSLVCASKPKLSRDLNNILVRAQTQHKESTLSLVRQLCSAELHDPTRVDITDPDAEDTLKQIKDHLRKGFDSIYSAIPKDDADGNAPAKASGMRPANPAKLHRPEDWANDQVNLALESMSKLLYDLANGADRLSDVVGRLAQAAVWQYVEELPRSLRVALELERVEPGVLKRARAACEPDEEVVMRRETLGKRLRSLQSVRDQYQQFEEA